MFNTYLLHFLDFHRALYVCISLIFVLKCFSSYFGGVCVHFVHLTTDSLIKCLFVSSVSVANKMRVTITHSTIPRKYRLRPAADLNWMIRSTKQQNTGKKKGRKYTV